MRLAVAAPPLLLLPAGHVGAGSGEHCGNYARFFRNLCAIGYTGGVSVEASTSDFETQAPASIALLRTLTSCEAR